MKRLLLTCFVASLGFTTQAQTFLAPAATERLGPSVGGSPGSSTYSFTNNVSQVSNADFPSVTAAQTVKIAGWSNGGLGGFAWGYDVSGLPTIYGAQIIGGTDVQVGLLESPWHAGLYALISYYKPSAGAYVCDLYALFASSTSLVYTKTLMTAAYNRISMDVSPDGSAAAFTWSDGTDVYAAFGKLAPTADSMVFSPTLTNPAIKITGGSSDKTLPDVAFASSGSLAGGIDSVYFAYYNDSASQVDLVKVSVNELNWPAGSTDVLPVRDYNTVSRSVAVELDATAGTIMQDCWGYAYADGYVKVRHQALTFGPVTITINNGSLAKGPAAMSVTGADYHPVMAYVRGSDDYSVGWTTTRGTNPYAYPHSMAMIHVRMGTRTSRDSLATKKDYQLINVLPVSTSVYVPAVLSFSTMNANPDQMLYAVHPRINPSAAPYADLIHQNHSVTVSGFSAFKLAETTAGEPFKIVPNPSSSTFGLMSNTTTDPGQPITLSVTDIMGRSILQYTGTAIDADAQLKASSANLSSGTYIISVGQAGKRQEFKAEKVAE